MKFKKMLNFINTLLFYFNKLLKFFIFILFVSINFNAYSQEPPPPPPLERIPCELYDALDLDPNCGGAGGSKDIYDGDKQCYCLFCKAGYDFVCYDYHYYRYCQPESDIIKCKEGEFYSGTECKKCPPGSYCDCSVYSKKVGQIGINYCPAEYPLSEEGNSSQYNCYKECSLTDVNNCKTVSGKITKAGENNCKCLTCEDKYTLSSDGKKCIAKTNLSCPAGEYLKAGEDTCSPCEEGYYCTGFNNHTYNGNKYGIEECPEGYRSNQAKGLTSIESCQIKCERDTYLKNTYDTSCTPCDITFGSELNYINYGSTSSCTAYPITCIPGTYRPKNAEFCETCPMGWFCEGGDFIYDKILNQGIKECPYEYKNSSIGISDENACYKECSIDNCKSGVCHIYKDNHEVRECMNCVFGYKQTIDKKDCEILEVNCKAGSYLKKNTISCSPCEEGHYCEGGIYTFNKDNDQGKTQCKMPFSESKQGSSNKEECYTNLVSGKYRYKTEIKDCKEGYYCKGGIVHYSETGEEGIKECPKGYIDGGIGLKSENECIKKCGIGSTGGKTKQGIDIEYEDPIESEVNYDNKCRYNKCSVRVGNRRVKGFMDNGECKIQCDPGYRMNNGTCEICNIAHATKYRSDGILECEVEECEEGYHATINGCEISKRECKKENIKKGYEYYREGIWGICEIEECNNGYHEEEGRCVENKRSCEVINGIGEEEYDTVKKEWKRCKATRCNPGYTNDVYKKNGGDINDCGECKNKYERNGEIAVISYIQECEIGSCVNEGSLYRLNDRRDRCEIICIEGEDESGRIYWDSITNRCEIECNDSYSMW